MILRYHCIKHSIQKRRDCGCWQVVKSDARCKTSKPWRGNPCPKQGYYLCLGGTQCISLLCSLYYLVQNINSAACEAGTSQQTASSTTYYRFSFPLNNFFFNYFFIIIFCSLPFFPFSFSLFFFYRLLHSFILSYQLVGQLFSLCPHWCRLLLRRT